MTVLLEFREKLRAFYGRHEAYLLPVARFLLALAVFCLINQKIGYMKQLNSLFVLLILSLACSLLPIGATLLAAGVLITLHCFALSQAAGAIILVLFLIMYLMYFRLATHDAYNALLVPVAYVLRIPYTVPVANGLLQQPYAVIPTICGVVTYYFLEGITKNAPNLAVMKEDEDILNKFQDILKQFTGNREMYLHLGVFIVVSLIVYLLRRLPIDYSWTVAIVVGILMQFLGFFVGYMQLGLSFDSVGLSVGCVVSALLLFVLQFFCFNLDYTRTENVQFEDDEYYYYVKAVPKSYVATKSKTVKKISDSGSSLEEWGGLTDGEEQSEETYYNVEEEE